MKRNEALMMTTNDMYMHEIDSIVEKIYDDFESQTCEHCRHMKKYSHNPMGISTLPVLTCTLTSTVKKLTGFCDEWQEKLHPLSTKPCTDEEYNEMMKQ